MTGLRASRCEQPAAAAASTQRARDRIESYNILRLHRLACVRNSARVTLARTPWRLATAGLLGCVTARPCHPSLAAPAATALPPQPVPAGTQGNAVRAMTSRCCQQTRRPSLLLPNPRRLRELELPRPLPRRHRGAPGASVLPRIRSGRTTCPMSVTGCMLRRAARHGQQGCVRARRRRPRHRRGIGVGGATPRGGTPTTTTGGDTGTRCPRIRRVWP